MKQSTSSDVQLRCSNVLINARYDYSRTQMDIFYFIISKLRKGQLVYELDISELSALTKNKYNLPRLLEATGGMNSKLLYAASPETGLTHFTVLQGSNYPPAPGTIIVSSTPGTVKVMLSEFVLPYMFDIKKNFSTLGLQSLLLLTSKFAKRIYPMCSQWEDKGETKKYDITEFKRMLGLIDDEGNEKLKEINDLRRTVLDPSVAQINEHTELHISYDLEKVRKSYKYITFKIKRQAPKFEPPFLLPPFEQDTPSLPPGINQEQHDNCVIVLDKFFEIKDPRILDLILSNAAHIRGTFSLRNDIINQKVVVQKTRAGLLFSRLSIKITPARPA